MSDHSDRQGVPGGPVEVSDVALSAKDLISADTLRAREEARGESEGGKKRRREVSRLLQSISILMIILYFISS